MIFNPPGKKLAKHTSVRWFNSNDDSDPAAKSNGLFFGVFGKVCDKLSELARTDFPMDCRISSR